MLDLVQLFEKYKNRKIAIYGLGTESEKALAILDGAYEIIGLLDGFTEEGELYGKPIVSLQYAIQKKVELIIVVARPGSCKAITKRIGNCCRENQIALIDIRGKDLLAVNRVSYDFSHIDSVTKEEFKDKIREAEVVSFDLFDTLIMRQTLSSTDVIRYVNCSLQEKGINIEDFCRRRLSSEKDLSKHTAPTLTQIYDNMLAKLDNDFGGDEITAKVLADLEWNIDFNFIIPRYEVCNIFREAVACGKRVYVVSDTYYSKHQLAEILQKCGITKYTDILSSSDYKTSKTQKLYSILKDKEKDKTILHIGDDIVADIESANKWGIASCRLFSGSDLWEAIGNLGLSGNTDLLSDCLRIGMFVSRIFNSPFQFETEDKRITVSDAYDIGYLFCAPMISDFVLWFYQQIQEQKQKNIWFSARDGYLIKKMYEHLLESYNQENETTYFFTSRIAAIRAGIQSKEDIQYVDGMKFSGTLEENLRERFGIEANVLEKESFSNEDTGLMKYKNAILDNARKEHHNYQKYLDRLNIEKGDIVFFDFVAKGTCQMFIQRLVDNHLKGLYFLQLETEDMSDKELDIHSFYSKEETDTSVIYDNYYILETLLTAPHPSVQGFDENGYPVFAEETRCDKAIRCFERAQEGIFDYFKTYMGLCPESERTVNKELDEIFLKLIQDIKITHTDFLNLMIEDPFFNRNTKITDVL